MTFSNGSNSFVAYALEGADGAHVTPDQAVWHSSESFAETGRQPRESAGITFKSRIPDIAGLTKGNVGGDLNTEAQVNGLTALFAAAFAMPDTTDNMDGTFTHVFDFQGVRPTFSAQVGWVDNVDTAFTKDITRALISGFTFSVTNDALPTWAFNTQAFKLGADEFAQIVPAYPAVKDLFDFDQIEVSVGGAPAICIDGFDITGAFNPTASEAICPGGDQTRTEYFDDGAAQFTGNIPRDFEDWSYHNDWTTGTPATITATLTHPDGHEMVWDLTALYTGATPVVAGRTRIKNPIGFRVDPSAPFTFTITNNDAEPVIPV